MPNSHHNRPTAREILAANMEHLRQRHGRNGKRLSCREIAKAADVAPGTVDKLCKTTGPSPQLNKLEPVAAYFGLQPWQLLMPDLPAMLGHSAEVTRLMERYLHSDESGRQTLNAVAERISGSYHTTQ